MNYMFRFCCFAVALFVLLSSLTYHARLFAGAQVSYVNMQNTIERNKLSAIMEKDIWQTTTMTDFYAANKLDFTFSSLISDYHTLERNIRLFTGLPKYVTRQLSPTEINTLQRLHERGKDTLTMLAEKHTRLSSNFAVLQTENERYERDFQAVFSIVTKLNPTEQYLLLLVEEWHLQRVQYFYVKENIEAALSRYDKPHLDRFLITLTPNRPPNKSVIHLHETFDATINTVAYSSMASNMVVKCNDKILPQQEGVAKFSFPLKRAGTYLLNATISTKNQAINSVVKDQQEYPYEVRQK